MLNKKVLFVALALLFASVQTSVMADEAVFSSAPDKVEVDMKPVDSAELNGSVKTEASSDKAYEGGALSDEKFKSAVNNLESAQVDVREQLASYKTQVAAKAEEVKARQEELNALKKECRALEKKMRSIEKMKKMLNEDIK